MRSPHAPRGIVTALVALLVVASCSSTSTKGTDSGASSRTTVTTITTGASSTAQGLTRDGLTGADLTRAGQTYGVGRRDVTFVDTTRGTPADDKNGVDAKTTRTLDTVVLYPTTDTSDDGTEGDHPVAPGRFPLLIFSHGVTASGPAYVGLMRSVAAAGYVVALPTYPLTSGPQGWDNLGRVVDQPGDVSFLIGKLATPTKSEVRFLAGHVSADAVAVAGHSLGAITSLFSFNSCCRDASVRAVVAISGMLLGAPDKSDDYDDPPKIPLLLLHGREDSTVPYEGGSAKIFDTFTDVPRALVTFADKGHVDVLTSPSLMPSIIAFLDLELRGDPSEWKRLAGQVRRNGDATIEVAGDLTRPE